MSDPATIDAAAGSGSRPAQSLASGTIAITAASGLFVLSGYVINIVLGRTLGPADYGLFGVVIGLMTVLNAVQNASIPQAVARFTAEQREPANDILAAGAVAQFVSGVVVGVTLFLLATPLASLFGDDGLAAPLRVAAFVLPPYAFFSLLMGFSAGRGRYSQQALLLSVYALAKAMFVVGLSAVAGLVGAIAGYFLAAISALPASGVWGIGTRRLAPLRPMLLYSVPLLLVALIAMTHLNLDLFFVKALVDEREAAGHYAAAQNVARVPYFLAGGFAAILLPAIARAAAYGRSGAQPMVRDALRLGFIAVAPLAALLAGSGDEVVRLLYGEGYSPANSVLVVLSPAVACLSLSTLLVSMLSGIGRPFLAVVGAGVGLAITALSCVLLVPPLGTLGAAVATLAGGLVAVVGAIWAAGRVFGTKPPALTFVRAGAAASAIGLAARAIDGNVALLVGLPGLLLLYGALLVVLRELTTEDWARGRALLRSGFQGRDQRC